MKIKGKTLNKEGKMLLAVVFLLAFLITLSINFVTANNEEVVAKGDVIYEVNLLDNDLELVNVVIQKDDTAWSIQSELTPEKNVSEIISQLEEMNGSNLEKMKPGDIVQFAAKK